MRYTVLILLFFFSLEARFCSFVQPLEKPSMELAFAAPRTFGRTHFIVGHSHVPPLLSLYSTGIAAPKNLQHESVGRSHTISVFFSPDDDVRSELIKLIDAEQDMIQAAVYIITDTEIAKALIRARNRNVQIELVTDIGCLKERSNRVSSLCDKGCKLYIYNPPSMAQNASSLMHHKFVLFSNVHGKPIIWTGSYNFTRAASQRNQENAILLEDKKTFDQFAYQFKRLKDRSYRYGKSART